MSGQAGDTAITSEMIGAGIEIYEKWEPSRLCGYGGASDYEIRELVTELVSLALRRGCHERLRK